MNIMQLNKNSSDITVISEPSKTSPFVIIYKPQGIPSAPLSESDSNCALFQAAKVYPEILNVKGKKEIEGGLIHRIDTVTDGLLVIASTQEAYDFLIKCQEEGKFLKTYNAKCTCLNNFNELKPGFPENSYAEKIRDLEEGQKLVVNLESFFRPFGPGRKEVRPVTENTGTAANKKSGSKLYRTEIEITKTSGEYSCKCMINNGYRHQVRSHLAWLSIPVKGDALYNPLTKEGDEFFFTASGLEFINPITKETVRFEI